MEIEERGWEAPEKFVCADCFEDEYLKAVVEDNVEETECGYCGKISDDPIAAPLSDVLEPISDALNAHFADPSSASLPRDDGEWIDEENIIDTDDALEWLEPGCEEDLFKDISSSFLNTAWYRCADGFWLGQHVHERLSSAWSSFEHDIKHRRRYFFNEKDDDLELYERPEYAPLEVLDAVGRVSQQAGLLVSIPAGTPVYRVRRMSGTDNYTAFEELGPPPAAVATAGRMNPPGIPYFYLSFDEQTALVEILDEEPYLAAAAKFESKGDMLFLNLANLPELPSIFDASKKDMREGLLFLAEFVKAITNPVKKDGREHIEYIPSQVVSEYFSQVFRTDADQRLGGIIYLSTVCQGGRNVVLFPRFEIEDYWEQMMGLIKVERREYQVTSDFYQAPQLVGFD